MAVNVIPRFLQCVQCMWIWYNAACVCHMQVRHHHDKLCLACEEGTWK